MAAMSAPAPAAATPAATSTVFPPSIPGTAIAPTKPDVVIRNVWRHNLEEEFNNLRQVAKEYRYIAFDTEFPGVVAIPLGAFENKSQFHYCQIAANVNALKIIQMGFCLTNEKGELPPGREIWQFNFHFSVADDFFNPESLELLRNSGIEFDRHRSQGIAVEDFGALLTTSGMVVNSDITWLTFHSCFDFGYLVKAIIRSDLPAHEHSYFRTHRVLFPRSYDLKVLLKMPHVQCAKLRGGLQDVADQLCVERFGHQHQAGSDALLTSRTFWRLKEKFFADSWDSISPEIQGYIYGMGNNQKKTKTHLH